jgi:DNA-binding transcriptional ArsR family regulator
MLDASDPPDERHAALPLSAESVLATSWLGRLNPCLCLDDVVHQRTRLALLCELNAAGELDFNSMKDLLCLSDGNLARHLTVLRAAGLIDLEKRVEGAASAHLRHAHRKGIRRTGRGIRAARKAHRRRTPARR